MNLFVPLSVSYETDGKYTLFSFGVEQTVLVLRVVFKHTSSPGPNSVLPHLQGPNHVYQCGLPHFSASLSLPVA